MSEVAHLFLEEVGGIALGLRLGYLAFTIMHHRRLRDGSADHPGYCNGRVFAGELSALPVLVWWSKG